MSLSALLGQGPAWAPHIISPQLPPPRQDTNGSFPLVLMAEPHSNISATGHNENQMAEAGFEASSIGLESTPEPTLRSCTTQFSLNVTPVCLHISLFLQPTHPTILDSDRLQSLRACEPYYTKTFCDWLIHRDRKARPRWT